VFLRAKTHTFFSIFSSSKVARLEVQVEVPAPPPVVDFDFGPEEDCRNSLKSLFADADEGGEDFYDAYEGGEDDADDQPAFKAPQSLSPQTRPSLTE